MLRLYLLLDCLSKFLYQRVFEKSAPQTAPRPKSKLKRYIFVGNLRTRWHRLKYLDRASSFFESFWILPRTMAPTQKGIPNFPILYPKSRPLKSKWSGSSVISISLFNFAKCSSSIIFDFLNLKLISFFIWKKIFQKRFSVIENWRKGWIWVQSSQET